MASLLHKIPSYMHVPGAKLVPHVHHAKQHQSGESTTAKHPGRISHAHSTGGTEANLWPQRTWKPTWTQHTCLATFHCYSQRWVETAPPVDRTLASVEAHFWCNIPNTAPRHKTEMTCAAFWSFEACCARNKIWWPSPITTYYSRQATTN